jgi:hypothetical protein
MNSLDDHSGPASYEIRLGGHLDPRWATQLEGLSVRLEVDGTTVLSGPIRDQAALHGLLQRVRDLGIPLLSLARLDPHNPVTARKEIT